QTNDVEADATGEGLGSGGRIGLEAFGFEGGENELVDRRANPGGVLDSGQRRISEELKGPMGAIGRGDGAFRGNSALGEQDDKTQKNPAHVSISEKNGECRFRLP